MPRQCVVWATMLVAVIGGFVLGASATVGARDDAPGERLSSDDALLERPVTPVIETLPRGKVVRTAAGDLVVTVEPGQRIDDILVSRPWTVRVYRPAPGVPDGWELALATRRQDGEDGPLFAAVTAKATDVTRDGKDELVIGYRSEGTGMILDVDIVGTDPGGVPHVLAHDQLYKGNVVFRRGRLVAWAPVYKRNDANCCPTWIQRAVLDFRDGAFSVEAGPRTPTRHVDMPPSELG